MTHVPQVSLVDPTLERDEPAAPSAEPIDPLDPNDRFSVLSLVGGKFREVALALPPELDGLNEGELKELARPTTMEYSLRASLWRAYNNAVLHRKTSIPATEIYGGVCTVNYFYRTLQRPEKVAWLLRPQQSYAREMEAILARGTDRLWEIVDMDIQDDDGKIDVKRARLLLEAIQEVGNRVKGMAVQRIAEDRRSLKMTVHQRLPAPAPKGVPQQSLKELRDRLAELEKGKVGGKALPAGPQAGHVVDAAPVGVVEVSGREGEREVVTVGVVRPAPVDTGEG